MTTAPSPCPLSLDLCRQLKAAGFAQDDTEFAYYAQGEHYADTLHIPEGEPFRLPNTGADCAFPWKRLAACPNSDELITALGDNIYHTERWDAPVGSGQFDSWAARQCEDKEDGKLGRGNTHVEALARLFLALHAAKGEAL